MPGLGSSLLEQPLSKQQVPTKQVATNGGRSRVIFKLSHALGIVKTEAECRTMTALRAMGSTPAGQGLAD